MHSPPPSRSRPGMVYLAVLGVGMIITTLTVGALLAGRLQTRSVNGTRDEGDARLNAMAGLEIARETIALDPAWRTSHSNGAWITGLAVGRGSLSVSVTDPADGILSNRPLDSVVLTSTGYAGSAKQILASTLVSSPTPLPILKYAVHTPGQFRIESNGDLQIYSATASSSGEIQNKGVLEGNDEYGSLTGSGYAWGAETKVTAAKALPGTTPITLYTNLATAITPGTTMVNQVLAAGYNPYGPTLNADGVYIWAPGNDATLRNCRIYGTLVVILPTGKTLTIDQQVFLAPFRTDFPALIVQGNVNIKYVSSTALSEATVGVNFNPPGAPYTLGTDNDTSDVYPSQIQGLVHVTGTVSQSNAQTIKGLLIDESATGSKDIDLNGTLTIQYDPTLYSSPPQGYTTKVDMTVKPASTTQNVN